MSNLTDRERAMLEALKALRSRWLGEDGETDKDEDDALIRKIDAAIALATGDKP